jgi:cobalt-zinc-cadmium efflux system protein
MQGAPKGMDKGKIKDKIYSLRGLGIKDIHHIHMWDITPGKTVFDAHIVVDKKSLKDADHIIERVNSALSNDFHISHSTIQIESEKFNHCVTCDL